MVSQHPDHASVPYWHNEAYIRTGNESKECFLSYADLGVDEYKWDWEGKLVDESVVERLLGEYFDYFQKHPLGKEKFLTFRLPNPKVETEFRLARAFMGLLTAANLAKQTGLHSPPLFEVILPMTESEKEMIDIQEAFGEVASIKHKAFHLKNGHLKHINVIPLFEQIDVIANSHRLLERYFALHKKKFGFLPSYMRPYLARSDPALNAGLVPTVLSIKIALSHYTILEKKSGIRLFPIIGSASLPFRGGLTPDTVEDFMNEYKGIKTALLQSAFRYDFDRAHVLAAIHSLEKNLPRFAAEPIQTTEERILKEAFGFFSAPYKKTIEGIAPLINTLAQELPKRRERVQHIGLFGYSRGLGTVTLPRAIGFTAALYSLGIPPELIGTGRGLKRAQERNMMPLIEKFYINLKGDLLRAGRYFNRENLVKLAKDNSHWQEVLVDIACIEKYLGEDLGPKTPDQKEHKQSTSRTFSLLRESKNLTEEITQAALLRRSLG